MSASLRKAVKAMLAAAAKQGCDVRRRHGHFVVKPPRSRSIIVVSVTPSDPRAVLNARAQLRRSGVDLSPTP
jgi:hypothetical protein